MSAPIPQSVSALEAIRAAIQLRIEDLRPAVAELKCLEAALAAIAVPAAVEEPSRKRASLPRLRVSESSRRVLAAMQSGGREAYRMGELMAGAGLRRPQAQRGVRALMAAGLVTVSATSGKTDFYALTPPGAATLPAELNLDADSPDFPDARRRA